VLGTLNGLSQKDPLSQSTHPDAVENEPPVLQISLHVDIEVAPTAVEYVPAVQDVHVDKPGVLPYVPDRHDVHVDIEVAPTAAEYVPAAQDVHVDIEVAPTAEEYVPV
jgi:hypothetical protein